MKRIIVVDDDEVVAGDLEDHLRSMGYEVSGHAAAGELAVQRTPFPRPDVSVTDASGAGRVSDLDVAEQLRESEARYRRVFEEALEGIYEVRTDGAIVHVNPAYAHMLGFESPEELVGRNQTEFYAEVGARQRILEDHAEAGTVSGVEAVWRRKEGELLNVELFGRTIYGPRREVLGYHGIVRDVTRERQHEAVLRFLSTGMAQLPRGAFFDRIAAQLAAFTGAEVAYVGTIKPGAAPLLRTEGLVIDGVVSRAVDLALRGTPAAEVVGAGAMIVASDVQHAYPEDASLRTLQVEGHGAAPLLGVGGEVIGVVGVMTRKPISHPESVLSILQVFALRTAAEIERQWSEARFVGVFEFAPDALLMVSGAGRVVMANRIAEEMLGYPREALLQLKVEDLVPEAERRGHAELRATFTAQDRPRQMGGARSQLWALKKDGSRLPVEISLSPVHTAEGTLVIVAIRDVSARVRAERQRAQLEDQLREAQRLESLGTLAGGIAHDFNNLLAAIVANVGLARQEVASGDPIVESLDEIATASARAAGLVRQILTFSQRHPTEPTITSIRAVLEEVLRLLRATIPVGIQLVLDIAPDVPSVLLDPTQLHQVLMNLGTNAWQAIPRKAGIVSFHLDAVDVDGDAAPVAGMVSGRYARIRVTDDGAGMQAATRQRIFEPFFTTKDVGKGTGLGLAVVHGIVAEHGGSILVDSVPDHGTSFSVYLPEAVGQAAAQAPSARPPAAGSLRVLLIDDEEPVLRVTRRILERFGYDVASFSRSADALDAVHAEPLRFDVVITDLNMPDRGGLDVARAIAALRPNLPIVLMSGNRHATDPDVAAASIHSYLSKPFTGQALADAVSRAMTRG